MSSQKETRKDTSRWKCLYEDGVPVSHATSPVPGLGGTSDKVNCEPYRIRVDSWREDEM